MKNSKLSLSEKEFTAMQYLEACVSHNLHNKSRKSELSESQQAMSFSKAGKADKNFKKISPVLAVSSAFLTYTVLLRFYIL